MAGPYTITIPVQGQPIPSAGYGKALRNAIIDLDARTAVLETGSQAVVKRGRRTTATGNITTTETGVLRIDDIPVKAGSIYQINVSNINLDASVDNDIGEVKLRYVYSASPGTSATTSSTQINHFRNTIDSASQSNVLPLNSFYVATADGYVSMLLSAVRVAGSGNIVVFCSASEILDFVVQFGGTDPGDTGVVI